MHRSKPTTITAVGLGLALLFQPALAATEAHVDYQLEMGSVVHQTYSCVFAGTVTANGKVCPGAHVMANLEGKHGQDVTQNAEADDQGHYSLQVTVEGRPQDETLWKLTAKAAVIGSSPSELEGRVILPEETTVMIERSIQLDGNGV